MNKRGFTLIELLVVISIIGILSSVVLSFVNGSKVKTRDAQRKSQLKQYSNAVELYALDHNGVYPGVIGYFTNIHSGGVVTNFVSGYISQIQDDPLYPSRTYLYMRKDYTSDTACETVDSTINTSTKYAFYAKLENPTPADLSTLVDPYDQCIASLSGSNYRVGN